VVTVDAAAVGHRSSSPFVVDSVCVQCLPVLLLRGIGVAAVTGPPIAVWAGWTVGVGTGLCVRGGTTVVAPAAGEAGAAGVGGATAEVTPVTTGDMAPGGVAVVPIGACGAVAASAMTRMARDVVTIPAIPASSPRVMLRADGRRLVIAWPAVRTG
jgi:hypothetical protein